MTWREKARPIIARVLRENAGLPASIIRGALRAAYPFGERTYYPYKAWLQEIAAQGGPPGKPMKCTAVAGNPHEDCKACPELSEACAAASMRAAAGQRRVSRTIRPNQTRAKLEQRLRELREECGGAA